MIGHCGCHYGATPQADRPESGEWTSTEMISRFGNPVSCTGRAQIATAAPLGAGWLGLRGRDQAGSKEGGEQQTRQS